MLQQFIDNLIFITQHLRVQDAIDMILVWMVVYRILVLIKRTGTIQMLSGLGVLAIGYILSIWLELFTFNWILEKFFSNLFLFRIDKILQHSARRHHRNNQITLVNDSFNHKRLLSLFGLCECHLELFTGFGCHAIRPTGLRKGNKVEWCQDCRGVTFVIEYLLPLSDHAQTAIVDHDAD